MIVFQDLSAENMDIMTNISQMGSGKQNMLMVGLEEGTVDPRKIRIMFVDGEGVASYSMSNAGVVYFVMLSYQRKLDDIEVGHLIKDISNTAENAPFIKIIVNKSHSRSVEKIEDNLLKLDSHSVYHLTPLKLKERELEEPLNNKFHSFDKTYLDSQEFTDFLENSDGEFSKNNITRMYTGAKSFKGLMLRGEEGPLAIGITYEIKPETASIQIIGVKKNKRNSGLGTEIHKALIKQAKKFASFYVGATDSNNTTMLRIFEKNGCILTDEQFMYSIIDNVQS
ncbi:GNAT family N-acetyltransferase [Deinococcus sp. QL22]|uniref:GNAT family N-acetyltransferase n=1 Tax=Deinococcus sp. QL22 TaxID=2939437 RepID=UPI002017BBED|nr:GNAT family protein [Deinococcus sp. QL22]UQN10636.1 GNAT family N-acetyltransferase [Deinococcus sp. QL22]